MGDIFRRRFEHGRGTLRYGFSLDMSKQWATNPTKRFLWDVKCCRHRITTLGMFVYTTNLRAAPKQTRKKVCETNHMSHNEQRWHNSQIINHIRDTSNATDTQTLLLLIQLTRSNSRQPVPLSISQFAGAVHDARHFPWLNSTLKRFVVVFMRWIVKSTRFKGIFRIVYHLIVIVYRSHYHVDRLHASSRQIELGF